MTYKKIAVIGAGSWGTALSLHLSEKFEQIYLWVYEKKLCDIIIKERENKWFLPEIFLPKNIVSDNSTLLVFFPSMFIISNFITYFLSVVFLVCSVFTCSAGFF